MKICILSAFEDSMLKDTGASVRIYNLAISLAASGNDVKLIIPKFVESCEHIQGVTVQGLKGFLPRKFLEIVGRFLGVFRPTVLFFYDPVFMQKASRIIHG